MLAQCRPRKGRFQRRPLSSVSLTQNRASCCPQVVRSCAFFTNARANAHLIANSRFAQCSVRQLSDAQKKKSVESESGGSQKKARWQRVESEESTVELDGDSSGARSRERRQRRAMLDDKSTRSGSMSPKEKLREWTRSYHQCQSANWMRRHCGLPLVALGQKYQQQRQYQRIWANRLQRREGYSQFWKPHCVYSQPTVHWDPHSLENPHLVDDDDMHYFFYEKAPYGYTAVLESPNAPDTNADGLTEENEKRLEKDEETIFKQLNLVWEWELRKLYADSFHQRHGWAVFSEAKKREAIAREFSKEVHGVEYSTQKLPPPSGQKLNPFVILPEQNPYASKIPFGGKRLKDYAEKTARRELQLLEAETRKQLEAVGTADGSAVVATEEASDVSLEFSGSMKEKATAKTKRTLKSMRETLPKWAQQRDAKSRRQSQQVTVAGSDGKPIDEKKKELLSNLADVRINRVSAPHTRHKSKHVVAVRGFGSDDDAYGVLKCTEEELLKDPCLYCDERTDIDHMDMFEEDTGRRSVKRLAKSKMANLDEWKLKQVLDKRPEVPHPISAKQVGWDIWWGKQGSFAAFKQSTKLMRRAFGNALRSLATDVSFVVREGGGSALRQGIAPQLSLMEFTAEEQMYTANGAYGPSQSLFSDWMLVCDRKPEGRDHSVARAKVVSDRLIFEGFLQHSGIEVGHRLRHRRKEHIGYANIACPEFIPELNLDGFHSIGLKLRSDGRPYFLTLECSGRNRIYLMAGIIHLPPTPDGDWDYYEIPMHHFRPFDCGEFVVGQSWQRVKWLRSFGLMSVGKTGPFHLEVAWLRAFREDARFAIEDEGALFIRDVDGMGLYEKDVVGFHNIQHQYFQDDFPDPFRFEDDGVYECQTYLGPPKVQREHFSKLDPALLQYVDIPDELPLPASVQTQLRFLEEEPMLHLESNVNRKQLANTKAIQKYYTEDNEVIANATNQYLADVISREAAPVNVFFNLQQSDTLPPYKFIDVTDTPNTQMTIVTHRRRKLLRQLIDSHLRELDPGKHPRLV